MDTPATLIVANPVGETKNARQYPPGSWPLDTPGGRYYAEWDGDAPVTREGQLIFFFQFLQAGGRWEEFLRDCPLHYTGNRGSGAPNVMGTVLLSVLSGHWRYAHINGVRGDGENGFDELKNQWGWNGFTTRNLAPCRLMANLIALIYNWWNLYLRFYDEGHHREAIRSRPMLMQGVARQLRSGGRSTVRVSVLHEKGDLIAHAVTIISKELHCIRAITERWSVSQRWTLLLTRLLRRWLGGKWLPGLPDEAALLLSG